MNTRSTFAGLLFAGVAGCHATDSELAQPATFDDKFTVLWAETQQKDQFETYLYYLVEQGSPHYRVEQDGDRSRFLEYADRRDAALGRMFRLALDTAHGTCPFSTLYVDLRQNVDKANGEANFPDWYRYLFPDLGITFVENADEADAVLVFELNGKGVSAEYVVKHHPIETRRATTGGHVSGSLWLEAYPQTKIAFSGEAETDSLFNLGNLDTPREADHDYGDNINDVSEGIQNALTEADFHYRVAELIYDVCSPEAGAYIRHTRDAAAIVGADFGNDTEETRAFDERITADYQRLRQMLMATALGPSYNAYDSPDAAMRIMEASERDRALLYWAKEGSKGSLPWERSIHLRDDDSLDEKLEEVMEYTN